MEPSTSRAGATEVTGSEFVEGTQPAVLTLDDAHAEMIAQYAASLPQREEAERRTTNWGKYPSTSWARARKRNKKAKRKRPGKIREPPALSILPLSPVRAIQGPINIRCSLQSGGGIIEQNPNIHRQESIEVALEPVDQGTLETTGNHAAVEVIGTGYARAPTDWTNLPDHLPEGLIQLWDPPVNLVVRRLYSVAMRILPEQPAGEVLTNKSPEEVVEK